MSTFDPTTLEIDQCYEFFDKSGLDEVMTLFYVNPTILNECQHCLHMDHVENILCDIYIVQFEYDPTCNYYERGRYGCRNLHVAKLPLVMLRLLLFLSPSLLCQILLVLVICFPKRCLCIGSMLYLDVFVTCLMMLSLCFNPCRLCEHHWISVPS